MLNECQHANADAAPPKQSMEHLHRLLAPDFWDGPLARFAKATGLVVTLYDSHFQRRSGPHTSSPLAICFQKAGFWGDLGHGTRIERELAQRAAGQLHTSCESALGALGLCSMPAIASGQIVGSFVTGWVPDQFIDPVVSNRIAEALGVGEMDVWQVMRMQAPMTSEKMLLYMEMLKNFAEVLLQQLENKERDREQARALRILNDSAIALSAATTARDICQGLSDAVQRLIPGADIAISIAGYSGSLEPVIEHTSSYASEVEIVAEHTLKVPIKSASQHLLGAIEIRLPDEVRPPSSSSELSTLAAQAAVALQKTKLISDLAQERNALDKANGELRNMHRMKDEFLATVSHELRTPLNSMLGWAQILKDDSLEAEEFRDATSAIERNARVQARLIEDLLDVSRIISGKMTLDRELLDLNEVLRRSIETVSPTCEGKRQSIEVDLPSSPLSVRGDSTRLQQVFWNILSNAAKFTPERGRIRVSTQKKSGAYVQILISDNGKGIPPAFVPHLFDRFSQADGSNTRAFGGLGLGLAIVRHICELHGGTVTAESEGEGKGATFTITLPLNSSDAELDSARALVRDLDFGSEGGRGQLRGLKVVAVDDQADSLRLIKFVLEKSGAVVRAFDNAGRAFEEVKKWHPDLIVSDISMPGESGYEFLNKVRQLPADEGGATPAFALTAHAGFEDKERAINAGYQKHFPKPLDPKALLSSIREFSGLH